jgi:hypothetical protein
MTPRVAAAAVALALAGCGGPGAATTGAHDPGPPPFETQEAEPNVMAPPAPSSPPLASGPEAEHDAGAASPLPRPRACPKASIAVTTTFARAAGLAENTGALEPHRALAEAVRMRLDELYQSGCRASLTDEQLLAELRRLTRGLSDAPSLFGQSLGADAIMIGHATMQGGGVALYHFSQGSVRTRIHVTSEGTTLEQRLLLLDATLFQPPGTPDPLLVLANTHPWHASCWRTLRFRVLAPSGDPLAPTALLDRTTGGRWCEAVTIETSGSDVSFQYLDWGRALTKILVVRPTSLAFRHDGQSLDERFGFVPGFEHLVEDWLMRPWALAHQATITSAQAALEPRHRALAQAMAQAVDQTGPSTPMFSFELFPGGAPTKRRLVVYCEMSDTSAACPDWPKPVDFALEQEGETWRVSDVKPRP